MTRVKTSHLSEEALAAQDQAYIESIQPKRQAPKVVAPAPAPAVPAAPKLSPEEEARQSRAKRIDEMIRKGRLEALKPMFERYPTEFDASLLGVAAASGQEDILKYLILEAHLDPTTPVDGKRAYDLSAGKPMRNAFRRIAYEHPDMFDWSAAHVPSGLSEEAEAVQNQKKAERRKGMREKMKERAAARAEEEEAEEKARAEAAAKAPPPPTVPTTGPQKLGGGGGATGLAGLSAEMRQQIERERRARAAEARFKSTS